MYPVLCGVHLPHLIQPENQTDHIKKRNTMVTQGSCANNNVGCQLYIQILAQYNPEVLRSCCREGFVCVNRQDLPRQ